MDCTEAAAVPLEEVQVGCGPGDLLRSGWSLPAGTALEEGENSLLICLYLRFHAHIYMIMLIKLLFNSGEVG